MCSVDVFVGCYIVIGEIAKFGLAVLVLSCGQYRHTQTVRITDADTNNNNMWIYKAHNVNTQAESEAPAVARWGWWGGKVMIAR